MYLWCVRETCPTSCRGPSVAGGWTQSRVRVRPCCRRAARTCWLSLDPEVLTCKEGVVGVWLEGCVSCWPSAPGKASRPPQALEAPPAASAWCVLRGGRARVTPAAAPLPVISRAWNPIWTVSLIPVEAPPGRDETQTARGQVPPNWALRVAAFGAGRSPRDFQHSSDGSWGPAWRGCCSALRPALLRGRGPLGACLSGHINSSGRCSRAQDAQEEEGLERIDPQALGGGGLSAGGGAVRPRRGTPTVWPRGCFAARPADPPPLSSLAGLWGLPGAMGSRWVSAVLPTASS